MRFCKRSKRLQQSCSGSACAREFAEHDCEHAGTGGREAYPKMLPVSQDLWTGMRQSRWRRSAAPEGISKDASVWSDAQRLGNSGSQAQTVLCAWRGRRGRPAVTF